MISKRLPSLGGELSGLRRVAERREQVLLAAERIVDAGHARGDHGGRRHAVARPHAAEIKRLLHMLAVAFPIGNAGALLGRERDRVAHLGRIEPQDGGGGRGGAEGGGQGVGAVPLGIKRPEAERVDRARPDVVAERDRAQEIVTAAAGGFRGGRARPARCRSPDESGP